MQASQVNRTNVSPETTVIQIEEPHQNVVSISGSAPQVIDEVVLNPKYPEDGYVNTFIKRRADLVVSAMHGWVKANPGHSFDQYAVAEMQIVSRIELSLLKHKDVRNEKINALRRKDLDHRFTEEHIAALEIYLGGDEPTLESIGAEVIDGILKEILPGLDMGFFQVPKQVKRSAMMLCKLSSDGRFLQISASVQNPKDEFNDILGLELALERMDLNMIIQVPISRSFIENGVHSLNKNRALKEYAARYLNIKL